eukprot:1161670-Pelagomonas_calceolata.AAC.24
MVAVGADLQPAAADEVVVAAAAAVAVDDDENDCPGVTAVEAPRTCSDASPPVEIGITSAAHSGQKQNKNEREKTK